MRSSGSKRIDIGVSRQWKWLRQFRVRTSYSMGQFAAIFNMSLRQARLIVDTGMVPSFRVPMSIHRRVAHCDLMRWLRSDPTLWFYRERMEWAEKLAALPNAKSKRLIDILTDDVS